PAVFENFVDVPPEERFDVADKLRVLEAWLIQRCAPDKKDRPKGR
ncbi:MAG: hypothetical protein JWM24_367, partial [Solirubrobacterales bacterium]|nr:hypothetical protein [Solirubrobacterales bacterium]